MGSPTQTMSPKKSTTILLLFFFCIISFSFPVEATSSKKLDQPVVTQPTNTEIKCGSCPCGHPCDQQLDPPPPPPPPPSIRDSRNCDPASPPPPPPPSPSPPPPTPPPPRFIYVTGEPGIVDQTDPYNWGYHNSATQNRAVGLLLLALLSITMVLGYPMKLSWYFLND